MTSSHQSFPSGTFRIGWFLALLVLAALAPWWVALPIALCTLFFWNAYELLAIGLFIDALYGGGMHFFATPYAATLATGVAVSLAPFLKRGIIFYS